MKRRPEAGGGRIGRDALRERIELLLKKAVLAWRDGTLTDEQAAYLDSFVTGGILETETANLSALQPLVRRYRELERERNELKS